MSKQTAYRNRHLAAGGKILYARLSAEAMVNLDQARKTANLSRAQLLEKMFKNPVDSASLPE